MFHDSFKYELEVYISLDNLQDHSCILLNPIYVPYSCRSHPGAIVPLLTVSVGSRCSVKLYIQEQRRERFVLGTIVIEPDKAYISESFCSNRFCNYSELLMQNLDNGIYRSEGTTSVVQ